MRIVMIRHGKTEGNRTRKYVGRTDEGLCEEGRIGLVERCKKHPYPEVTTLLVSPMKRCIETAQLIYPTKEMHLCEGFRECDFGNFEYKNHMELTGDVEYQAWIDSNGTTPFPNGEALEDFQARCVKTFVEEVGRRDVPTLGLVVHGGTIMSILSALCSERANYFDWMVDNGCGYVCEYHPQTGRIQIMEEINE